MAILIRNAYVFAPKELGVTDVLMVGEKILAVAPNLSASLPGLSIIDATGFILAPGFVDAHVHAWAEAASTDQIPERRPSVPVSSSEQASQLSSAFLAQMS